MRILSLKELLNKCAVMTVHNMRKCVDFVKEPLWTEYITSNKYEKECFV